MLYHMRLSRITIFYHCISYLVLLDSYLLNIMFILNLFFLKINFQKITIPLNCIKIALFRALIIAKTLFY